MSHEAATTKNPQLRGSLIRVHLSKAARYRIVRLSEWRSCGWGAERGPDEIPPKRAPVRPPGTIANFTLQLLESHMLFGRPGGADGQSGTLGAVGSTHCIAVDNQSVDNNLAEGAQQRKYCSSVDDGW